MPELVYDVKFRIDPASARSVTQMAGGGTSGTASEGTQISRTTGLVNALGEAYENVGNSAVKSSNQSKRALKGVGNQAALTSRQMNQLVDAQNKTGRAAARTSKNFSVANQTLFSLSDGLQDAAQFSQGFGVGMRAIGNNVGFTLELMTSLSNRVKEHNALVKAGAIQNGRYMTTFGALGAALSGPGGWLLYLNAAITAITVLTTRSKKAEQEASKLTETLLDQAKAHRELAEAQRLTASETERDSSVIRDNIQFLQSSVQAQKDYITALENSSQSTVFGISRTKALSVARENLKKTIDDISKAEQEYSQQKIREAITLGLSADASEREFELRKQATEKTQEATSILASFSDQTGMTEDALNKAFIEGNNLLAFFRSSSVLTADQVAIAKELDTALLQVADSFAALSAPSKPAVMLGEIGTLMEDVIMLREPVIQTFQAIRDGVGVGPVRVFQELADIIEDIEIAQTKADYSRIESVKQRTDAEIRIEMMAQRTKQSIISDAVSGFSSLAQQAFSNSKEIAIATTVIETYVAAQMAYKNALAVPGVGIGLASLAAASAIASGLARVLAIRKTEIGSGSVSDTRGGQTEPSFGFQMNAVEGPQTFRTPEFIPTSGANGQGTQTKVEILADRKQLYYIVKRGEEEYRSRSV